MPLIRLPGEPSAHADGSLIELVDSQAYVDLGFQHDPGRAASGLMLLRDDRQDEACWYRWWPLGNRDPSKNRRMGAYTLSIPALGVELNAYVRSSKLLSDQQYALMLEDIMRFSPVALWDHPQHQGGRARMTAREDALHDKKSAAVSLALRLQDELVIARSALLSLRWELAPSRPDRPATTDRYRHDFDVNENRALLAWARLRLGQVCETLRECNRAFEIIRGEEQTALRLGATDSQQLHEDLRALEEMCASLRTTAAGIQQVQTFLSAKGVSASPWIVTPSVTRNPHVAPLVTKMSTMSQVPYGAELHKARLSVLAQRQTSYLYELWVALAVPKLLERMGFVLSQRPIVNMGESHPADSLALPYRIVWDLERDDLTIRWHYYPRVAILDPDTLPEPTRSLHLAPADRIAEVARLSERREDFITWGTTNSPDYILQLETGENTSFVVADATCADARVDEAKGLKNKMLDIRSKYAQKILWIDRRGLATPCSAAASFAVCPLIPDEFKAALQARSGEVQVLALELSPWLLDPPAEVLARFESIIASLEWFCRRTERRPHP